MSGPHQVTRDFEAELCRYTGAPYAVAVNSCTAALMLAVRWCLRDTRPRYDAVMRAGDEVNGIRYTGPDKAVRVTIHPPLGVQGISIPKHTYCSVPMAIIHAGGRPVFRDEVWRGMYKLEPLPVWDSARMFTSDMHLTGTMTCVSFHAAKTLGDTQGGAILHDNAEADAWLRRARFDGRAEGIAPKDDKDMIVGYHCYLSPDVSARLLMKLTAANFPRHNEPLANDDYPDLSTMECFK